MVSINYNYHSTNTQNPYTKEKMSVVVATDAKQQTVAQEVKRPTVDEMTCGSTLKACALLTADALCCIPCCMCFGGCCGKYEPYAASAFSDLKTKPGEERFASVCLVQCMAAMLMPFTCCGCFWACCGTCSPCARGVLYVVKSNDAPVAPSTTVTKPPTDQDIDREIRDFTNNFLAGK